LTGPTSSHPPGRSSSIVPVASTCPCTKWPPTRRRRASGARGSRRRRASGAERRDPQRLGRHVHVDAVGVGGDHSQTDAVDGQRVPGRQLRDSGRAAAGGSRPASA
jgi:hypothetical protein